MEENLKTTELCECCGERAPEPGQPYCADCLERMRKYPFHWWHVIVPVIMLMFAALAVLLTIHMWPVFSGAAEEDPRCAMIIGRLLPPVTIHLTCW